MMKTRLSLAGAALLALALAAGPARADGGHPCGGMAMGDHAAHFARVAAALGLSAAQEAAAKKLHQETSTKAAPLTRQSRQQHDQIHALLDAGNADPTQIGRLMITAHATHRQLEAIHQAAMSRFTAVLTADQRARFEKMKQQHTHGGHAPFAHDDGDED